MKNNQLLIHGPIGFTSYGLVVSNLIKTFNKLNIKAYPFPIGLAKNSNSFFADTEEEKALFEKLFEEQITEVFDSKAPTLKVWHQFDLAERIGKGLYAAFPFFELDLLNPREKVHLNIPDQLFVSSQWAKNVLLDNNITVPINIAPLAVDTTIFDHKLNMSKNSDSPYVFIMIGKWEVRKGYDILLDLFQKAFTPSDNVELWILASSDKACFDPNELSSWHSYYQNGKMKDKIKIFPRLKTQQDVAKVIAQADCGIFMNRAEGWNLDLLEVMSMNKPVITTNYSAHTEFCNNNNAHLINIDKLEPAYDGKWFFGNGNWAHIGQKQMDQAIEYMRSVVRENVRTNEEGVKTGQKFSWNNTAQQIIQCILN
jgi:glycosyltransferase involved in cell wall biosynthesis